MLTVAQILSEQTDGPRKIFALKKKIHMSEISVK